MSRKSRWIDRSILALASGFFLSYLPYRLLPGRRFSGAGLVGTLWGVVCLPLLPQTAATEAIVLLGVGLFSIWIAGAAEPRLGHVDDPRIVIDEFIGYWITVAFLPRTFGVIVAGFILFRFFDVVKCGPIRRFAELPGGWGVVLDDVSAGLCGNACLQLARWLHIF